VSLRDTELDVAKLLEAAGLGSLADGSPTLFAGPYPTSAPDAFISCRQTDADPPEKYLGNVPLRRHRETVTVLVRGGREPGAYSASRSRALAAWQALAERYDVPGYDSIDCQEGAPNYLGEDEEQRPQWSFSVSCEYATGRP
jgi:hypothetical protein